MSKTGYFTDIDSFIVDNDSGDEYSGGACSCVVEWESEWLYGNTHSITLTVQGVRTDGYSASLFGHIKVGDNSTESLGTQNYPGKPAGKETFEPVTYDVETDNYGNLITEIVISVGFSRNSSETHYATATSKNIILEQPQKSINIDTPDGIICTINKSPLYIDDEFVITVTVTGSQWSDSPIISVTGATKIDDLKYKVISDVFIVVTGVLATHTIYISTDVGTTVSVKDETTGAYYGDGANVEHYTNITIKCDAIPGYKFDQLLINGEAYDNGHKHQVVSDVLIVASSNVLGLARIFTGSSFESFYILIFNGSSWDMYIPLIFDGSCWNICA